MPTRFGGVNAAVPAASVPPTRTITAGTGLTGGGDLSANRTIAADLTVLAPLASPTFTGTVTVPTTVNATDAAQKSYVDAVAAGLSIKGSCRLGTVAALPANANVAGVLTATAFGALSVDGSAVAVADRILVKNEAAQANNGIYVVTATGGGAAFYVLTRSSDMNTGAEVPGAFAFVEAGTVNAGAGFVVAGAGPYTINVTAIVWTQFSGAGEITAGAGLSKSGNTLTSKTLLVDLGTVTAVALVAGPSAALITPTAGQLVVLIAGAAVLCDVGAIEVGVGFARVEAGVGTSQVQPGGFGSAVPLADYDSRIRSGAPVFATWNTNVNSYPVGASGSPAWAAAHVYAVTAYDGTGALITESGHLWSTTGGTSGGAKPNFAGNIGGTVADNGMTWTDEGAVPTVGSLHLYALTSLA